MAIRPTRNQNDLTLGFLRKRVAAIVGHVHKVAMPAGDILKLPDTNDAEAYGPPVWKIMAHHELWRLVTDAFELLRRLPESARKRHGSCAELSRALSSTAKTSGMCTHSDLGGHVSLEALATLDQFANQRPEPIEAEGVDFPNPSHPMTKKEAAGLLGITSKKLTSVMNSGGVRFKRVNRQTFIFCSDDLPQPRPK